MTTKLQFSNLIKEHCSTSAIILGNGINIYANTGCSWLDLLKNLAEKYCPELDIADADFKELEKGFSYTEFFDAMEISVLNRTPYSDSRKIDKFAKSIHGISLAVRKAEEAFGQINTSTQGLTEFNIDYAKNKRQVEAFSNAVSKMPDNWYENLMTSVMLGDKLQAVVNDKMVESICKEMNSWQFADIHCNVGRFAEKWNIPILTTNYDINLEQSINAQLYDYKHEYSNDSCPISCCYTTYSDTTINDFAIWHINGVIKYPKSILIGLSHYMRCLQTIRGLILPHSQTTAELFNGNNIGFAYIKNTWLELIFSRNLFIIGLQLDVNEVVLRWLLLERAKYYALYNRDKRKAWYVITKKEYENSLSKDLGKRMFFNSVGVEILVLPDYKDIYEAISIEDK
jgi:hypothetical protein